MTNFFVLGSTVMINKEELRYLWAGLRKCISRFYASHEKFSMVFFLNKRKGEITHVLSRHNSFYCWAEN